MRKPSAAVVLSSLLAASWVGFLASSPRAAQEDEATRPVWRYRTTTEQQLEALGAAGWEAYAVTKNSDSGTVRYYLKKRGR